MHHETQRLILRPWLESDASDLYEYAKDPLVGPIAGWPVHTSVENSKEIIKTVLSAPETYAVVLKETDKIIGSIGIMRNEKGNIELRNNEAEIGFWLGVPYWGKGIIPEAVHKLLEYAFVTLHVDTMWCLYFDGNQKSARVQEKCGFTYHHTKENVYCALIDETRIEHVNCLTKQQWLERQNAA